MNIIIPMAGRGSRIRPHSITTPKPLLPVAGKTIVERLVRDLVALSEEKIDNIGFIIAKDFGAEVEKKLIELADSLGAKGHIFYQESPEGIAHALLCADTLFTGKVIVALADTLFVTNEKIDTEQDGELFVQAVEDPSAFGVVTLDDDGNIAELIEKPKEFISDKAIVGIYYFKDGCALKQKMNHLLDNNIRTKGEYQLTDAIELLRKDGAKLKTLTVSEWLDCGNKNVLIHTNQRVLEHNKEQKLVCDTLEINNSIVIPPCYIGKDVKINDSIVGPYASIDSGVTISKSIVSNSIVQANSIIEDKIIEKSMLGKFVSLKGRPECLSVGDYSFTEN